MPAVSLSIDDLTPFATIDDAKAQAMIDTAMARAARVAPCIREETLSADNAEAAKGVIRDAVLRWNEAGSGALQSQSAGPFGMQLDTRQQRRALFWPSDIEELQAICRDHRGDEASGAFTVDTLGTADQHAPWCALNMGANYCDCGAIYAGYPLWSDPNGTAV